MPDTGFFVRIQGKATNNKQESVKYSTKRNPKIRTATIDFGRVSRKRHNIAGILEMDVTIARENLKKIRKDKRVSFNGWLVKVISDTLVEHKQIAAYVRRKKRLFLFDDVTVSLVVEKEKQGIRVPIPLLIQHTNRKNPTEISREIEIARQKDIPENEVILHEKMSPIMKVYYYLPPFLRRYIWKTMIRHPRLAYGRMGNVVISSVGMMGRVNGWFIHSTLHPVSFGIGSITEKPWVIDGKICVREILHMTILFDHDVVDGGEMARFVNKLVRNIEQGSIS